MAYTKKAINDKYNKLRAQLKKGEISQSNFKAAANRLYELYHSDANKATRNKVGPKAAPAKPKAGGKTGAAVLGLGGSNVRKGTLNKKSNGDGTYGQSLPSNPPLKSQPKKPKRQGPRAGSRAAAKTKPRKRTKPTAPNRYQRRRRGM